ncbi:glutamine amidotransferase [Marinobacter sp. SS21]|uniref:glutamine amidotransferase n=1 Tax=Marinobacter sp. SS21 TaxID=2979460 RepID=UPI00232B921A|nr:glutamine amidotransferase [Marinobacter sp. SS21]MDC0662735.1 glutamine amidotransferase [Marinobacter sp. SS21]
MSRVVILKTGSTYPAIASSFGDFEDWFVAGLSPELALSIVDVERQLPDGQGQDWDGIVITGSPAMVSDCAAWSERTAQWLAQAVKQQVPVLGVCYGHQLLAHALGGRVGNHPEGRESGTFTVTVNEQGRQDRLLGKLPQRFPAQLTHLQSVLALPAGATVLASSEFEPHQAFRVGANAWGVQFHPEFSAPVMRAYLEVQAPSLREEGLDPDALIAAVTDTPAAGSLLRRFSQLVLRQA